MASGGSAPAPADYVGASRAQGQANLDSARLGAQLNRVNQYGPMGSITYRRVGSSPNASIPSTPTSTPVGSVMENGVAVPQLLPGGRAIRYAPGAEAAAFYANNPTGSYTPSGPTGPQSGYPAEDAGSDQWEQITTLSPEQQQIFNAQQGNQLDLSSLANMRIGQAAHQAPLDTYNPGDFGQQRQDVTDAQYRAATRMLDPQFEQGSEALRTRLLNSGVREGSEAYNNEMGSFDRSRQAAYGDARDRALVSGGQEQSRLLADALRGRQQQVSERQVPLEESLALMQTLGGGTGGLQAGAIPQVGGPQAPDIQGAVGKQYTDQYNQYAADEASAGQTNGGLMSLAAMAAMYY